MKGILPMIRKKGLWYTINYYRIPQLLLAGIILLLLNGYITDYMCNLLSIREKSTLYNIIQQTIPVLILIIWFVIVLTIEQERIYYKQTGHNLFFDKYKYRRSFYELMDYFKDAEPHKLDVGDFPESSWRNIKGFVFGKVGNKLITIPSDSECNIAIQGPPGSGKTSGLAIINAITFAGSVLAVDVKGDLYNFVHNHTKRKILRFCPDSPTALKDSLHFNPLQGFFGMNITDQKLYLEAMATVLIPDEGGSESNYFSSRARKMFQGITHMILNKNPDASFPDIVHTILEGDIFSFVKEAIAGDCIAAKELLASFFGNSEKNVSSAFDALTTALVHFSNPVLDELLSNKGKMLSIKALESGYDVYLQISQEHLDAYAPLFTLIIQSLSTAFTKRPDSSSGFKNRPILMLLDEFPQLTFSYKLINSNLSTLRSKSIICMLIQQNLSQLEHRYQPTGARTILGNCNYQIILGSNDINSSKVYSDMFGNKKVLKVSNSETKAQNASSGWSTQESKEKVFEPEYFGDLPANNKMIVYFKGKYVECDKLNCYKDIKKK